MSIRLNSVKVDIGHNSDTELKKKILKSLRINEARLISYKPSKVSIDARKKNDIKYIYSFDIEIKDEALFLKNYRVNDVTPLVIKDYEPFKNVNIPGINESERPIIVGFGPAGMFCALFLARKGLRPIVIERGEDADSRIRSVNEFWQGGKLNTSSNVQFGEGGAGTFSDGKLNTLIKDPTGRIKAVYSTFVKHGADEAIMYMNKPHIGTDRLVSIVKSIREEIISLGGEVRFNTLLKEISIGNNAVKGVHVSEKIICGNDGTLTVSSENKPERKDYFIECSRVVLAIGHSARDTFEMLINKGFHMEQKPFAMGVRVQHPQSMINKSQYGEFADKLPPADYKLAVNLPGGRGVYSFCMCPGGFVVNASSEEGRLAVNGMSNSKRDENTANSAIVVSINTSDFPDEDPLAGMRLQRELEKKAFDCCNGLIPVEKLGDFNGRISKRKGCPKTVSISEEAFGEKNEPNIKGLWQYGSLDFLPDYIAESIFEAFPEYGRMIKGFDDDNTLLIGLESRTSSPVRIVRDEKLQAVNIKGIYPCGEGAGYAGGITSAAVDGLKVFEEIVSEIINE